MAISERIHFFRNLRGMTQKYLGLQLGFPDKSADVRMAQYETGSRTPKADITAALAQVLDVAPEALNVPDIDSYISIFAPSPCSRHNQKARRTLPPLKNCGTSWWTLASRQSRSPFVPPM